MFFYCVFESDIILSAARIPLKSMSRHIEYLSTPINNNNIHVYKRIFVGFYFLFIKMIFSRL